MLVASVLLLGIQAAHPVRVGWHDEMNRHQNWEPLAVENKPKVDSPKRGSVRLSLGPRPADWPYQYQWSAVTRDAKLDVARFPVLTAKVRDINGYAHLDIEVLDAKGKAVQGFRSPTLTTEGVSSIDLGKLLDPATYSLRIRLVVGGPNQGCTATYDWIRTTNQEIVSAPSSLVRERTTTHRSAPRSEPRL